MTDTQSPMRELSSLLPGPGPGSSVHKNEGDEPASTTPQEINEYVERSEAAWRFADKLVSWPSCLWRFSGPITAASSRTAWLDVTLLGIGWTAHLLTATIDSVVRPPFAGFVVVELLFALCANTCLLCFCSSTNRLLVARARSDAIHDGDKRRMALFSLLGFLSAKAAFHAFYLAYLARLGLRVLLYASPGALFVESMFEWCLTIAAASFAVAFVTTEKRP